MSAPISRNSRHRRMASSSETHARASVRAMIRMSVPAVARVDRRAYAHERFITADDRLPLGVPAAFWGDLILEHDRSESRGGVPLDRAFDVLRAAEAGVAVADERYGHGAADVLTLIDELGVRDEAGVGHPSLAAETAKPLMKPSSNPASSTRRPEIAS